MHFEFLRSKPGGLPVIAEIPHVDSGICHLEGRNGIGKSLAIRLLQICVGSQPYAAMPGAWETLRASLGPLTVRASGLRKDRRIEWRIVDPTQWPEARELLGRRSVPMPDDTWFEITVDDQAADLATASRLLSVERIDGAESLQGAIGRRIRDDAARVERLGEALRGRTGALDAQLSDVATDLADVRNGRVSQARQRLREAEDAARAAATALEEARERVELLQETQQLVEQVARATDDLPALEQRLAAVDADIRELRPKRDAAQRRLDELAPLQGRFVELAQDHRREQEKVQRRRRNLATTTRRIKAIAEALALDPSSDAVASLQGSLSKQLETVRAQRSETDATPDLLRAGADLSKVLQRVRRQGHENQPIAELPDRLVTIGELDDGVARRVGELRGRPPSSAAAELDREVVRLTGLIHMSRELSDLLKRRAANERSLLEAEGALHEAARKLSGGNNEAYKKASEELHGLRLREEELNATRGEVVAAIRNLTGNISLDQLRQQRTARLAQLGIREEDVAAALRSAQEVSHRAAVDVEAAEQAAVAARAHLDDLIVRLRTVINRVHADSGWDWLRQGARETLPSSDLPEESNLHRVEALACAVDEVRNRLTGLSDAVLGTAGALLLLADYVDPGAGRPVPEDVSGFPASVANLMAHYEKQLGKELSRPEIERELFGGVPFDRLSLKDMAVVLRDETTGARRRSLEAFSSGERAWAYTLARLAGAERPTAENRLLVLDEFGAFVARDRMVHLVGLLRDQVLGHAADQVIVILPLQEFNARNGTLDEHSITDHSSQVDQRGYFTDTFALPA